MAGERKGITYEAFVKIALEELVHKGHLRGQVFWNEKPDDMTIEPDFTVGLTNNIRYDRFSLSFLLDFRKGGDVFNATEHYLTDRTHDNSRITR